MKALESSVAGDIWRHSSTANNARRGYYFMFNNGLEMANADGAGRTTASIPATTHRCNTGVWEHWAITFRTNEGYVRGYKNGKLIGQVFQSRTPNSDGLGTTNELLGSTIRGQLLAQMFDIQLHLTSGGPEIKSEDIPLLMRPDLLLPSCTARYYGKAFRSLASSGVLIDETGKGNNLTNKASLTPQFEEPPYLPTYQ